MSFSHRFFLWGPFLLFVAFAAGIMIYWGIAADRFAKHLDALNGHEVAPGVTMHFAAKRIAGFPFRLDVVFTDFTLRTADSKGPIVWHTGAFATHTLTYATGTTVMESAGAQDISWTSAAGVERTARFTPGTMRASAIVRQGRLAQFDLDIVALSATRFAARHAQLHIRHDPTSDALDVVADLDSVRFAGDAAQGFANGLSHARVEGRLAPGSVFAPALEAKEKWLVAIETWRRGNGVFKVDQAAAFWGRCEETSSGNVALDEDRRLKGALDVSLKDCDALAKDAKGIVAPAGAHRPVLAVLADLAAREPADRSDTLPVTVVLRDGLIFIGPGKMLGRANAFFEPVGFLHAFY